MLTFDGQKARLGNIGTIGQQMKEMSDMVMQTTFDNDIATRQCYIYDYYHDDQKESLSGYNPLLSLTKKPVKLKFIVKEYKSASKDDPEYHIQFEPDEWNNQTCKPEWFDEDYGKYDIRFPISLYVDIPNDRGVYSKWLIFYDEPSTMNPKFGIIKCNYLFEWITEKNDQRYIRKMWGTERTQNSYTSGEWSGDKFTVFDEQGKFWLPWTPLSSEIEHDMRLAISMLQPKPYMYKVTKIKNTSPKGIVTITVKQDEFNQHVDYVDIESGDMIADYYKYDKDPVNEEVITDITNDSENNNSEDISKKDFTLSLSSKNNNAKLDIAKTVTAILADANGNSISDYNEDFNWKLLIGEEDVSYNTSVISNFIANNNVLKFTVSDKATKNVRNTLIAQCTYGDMLAAYEFIITLQ